MSNRLVHLWWDWRRRLEDTVSFFLGKFVPLFQGVVNAKFHGDPLKDFVLVGHSFGGMIINFILRQHNSVLNSMTRAITTDKYTAGSRAGLCSITSAK